MSSLIIQIIKYQFQLHSFALLKVKYKASMEIYNLGWLGLPIVLYFIYKKYYLFLGELWLLYYCGILLFSIIIDGWIMQITYLIIVTAQFIQVLGLCKESAGIIFQNRHKSLFTKVIFSLEEQFTIIIYLVAFWLFIRIYTIKSLNFGVGIQYQGIVFNGLIQTLNGWNCTAFQFTFIPLIWLIICFASFKIAKQIIQEQSQKDHLYKEYILKYKVIPDALITVLVILYNFYSYWMSDSLFKCRKFWQNGDLIHIFLYLGYPFTTLLFFRQKNGIFQVQQNSSDKAQQDQKANMEMIFLDNEFRSS